MQIKTQDDLLGKLRSYTTTPDDDVIQFKEKIKNTLLRCPELLYALNSKDLKHELFDESGELNATYNENGLIEPLGAWDEYFGYHIKPYLFIEQTQTSTDNFLCYTVSFNEIPKYNSFEYYAQITFTALCSTAQGQAVDGETGIPRHDLIGSILREKFALSNIFGMRCKLISNQEKSFDANYISRQLVFELTKLNTAVYTPFGGKTEMINHLVRK